MAHTCHATACTVPVPPEMFMCKRHWFSLPKKLRDNIWRTYRPGQCDDMSPSEEYCLAAKECVEFLAKKEGREPDTALYDMFISRGTMTEKAKELIKRAKVWHQEHTSPILEAFEDCPRMDCVLARALEESERERERLVGALRRVDRVLRVPAAEYVPAISDAFSVIDEVLGGKGEKNR